MGLLSKLFGKKQEPQNQLLKQENHILRFLRLQVLPLKADRNCLNSLKAIKRLAKCLTCS